MCKILLPTKTGMVHDFNSYIWFCKRSMYDKFVRQTANKVNRLPVIIPTSFKIKSKNKNQELSIPFYNVGIYPTNILRVSSVYGQNLITNQKNCKDKITTTTIIIIITFSNFRAGDLALVLFPTNRSEQSLVLGKWQNVVINDCTAEFIVFINFL